MSVVPQYNMRTGWGRGPDRAALLSACFLTLLVVTTLEPPTSHVLASGTRNMRESFMTIFISKHGERNSALYPSPPPTPPDYLPADSKSKEHRLANSWGPQER